jgi:hypothetical protein
MMQVTQERINQIQGALAAKRDEITARKSSLNTVFLALYTLGSLTVLTGSLLNTIIAAKSGEAKRQLSKR